MRTKIVPLALFVLSCGMSLAQPQLSQKNVQVIGDTTIVYKVDTTGLTIGGSGANVNWDYSALDSIGTITRYSLAPSATPYAGLYPISNQCEKIPQGSSVSYQYYNSQSTQFTIVGYAGTNIDSIIYSDYDTVTTFPIQYNGDFSDSSVSTIYVAGGAIHLKAHNGRHTHADAYGTLILPNATYNNVLRYKNITYTVDSSYYNGNLSAVDTFYIEEYFWSSAHYRPYLLYMETMELKNGKPSPTGVDASFIFNPKLALVNGASENSAIDLGAVLYPNPVRSESILKLNTPVTNGTLKLLDALGREIRTVENINGKEIKINKQSLTSGMYFYRVSSDNKIVGSGKIIIE